MRSAVLRYSDRASTSTIVPKLAHLLVQRTNTDAFGGAQYPSTLPAHGRHVDACLVRGCSKGRCVVAGFLVL